MWEELTSLVGAEHELTHAYSKEENGIVERANKEVIRHLRNIIFDRDVILNWSSYLPLVRRIFNSSIHSIIGVAPMKVIFGDAIDLNRNLFEEEEPETSSPIFMDSWILSLGKGKERIVELVRNNLEKQHHNHLQRSQGIAVSEFEIGSYVLVEHVTSNLRRGPKSKLLPFLKGPMKVISVNEDYYTLRNLITRKDKEYHVKRLHEFLFDPQTINPLKIACIDSGSEYMVEFIEKMKGNPTGSKENMKFLVHWVGFESPTWEPWKNVRHTYALYNFLSQQDHPKYRNLIPKNIKYIDSDDDIESDESERD